MADDSVLGATKESSERMERGLAELSGEIRTMAHAITAGFSRAPAISNGNGGLYGIIATFAVVIISLGSIFFAMIASQSDRVDLLAAFQKERLAIFSQHTDEVLAELDVKLQLEISAEAALRDRRFAQAEADSANRHDAQQAQIDEIKAWFKPPALRNNDEH